MATLYTPEGQPTEIPDAEVHDALVSRKFLLPMGQQVPVESADGTITQIPSEQVYAAIQRGDRIMGPEEAGARARAEKYGGAGQGAVTAVEQGLSGATAGISEAVEKGFGVPPEDIAGRKEAHPIVSPIAGVTGAVAPMLFGDEVAPVSMIAKGGEAVESFFGHGLAGAVLRGASEAGTYGAIDEASQQAFSGKPADVSKVLSVAGTDAVFGGGVGGFFGVLGAIGRKASGMVGKGVEEAAGASGDSIRDIADALEAKAENDPTTVGGKVLGALLGKEKGAAMSRLVGDRGWRDLANITDADAEKMYIDGAAGIGDLMRDFQGGLNDLRDVVKPEEIAAGLKNVDPVAARARLFELANKVDEAIVEMRAQPENFFDSAKIGLLEKQNAALKKVIGVEPIGIKGFDPVTAKPIPTWGLDSKVSPTAAEMWEEADRFRDKLGTIGKLGMSVPETEQAAAGRINQIRKELLRPLLEDQGVWGEAAAAQAERNAQISKAITLMDDFNEAFGKGSGYSGGERVYTVDPGKLKRLFQMAGSAENELPRATFMNFLSGARDLAEQVGQSNHLRDRLAAMLPGTKDLAMLSKARGDLAKIAGRTGEAASIFGAAPLMRVAAGAAVGGPLGAVIGAAAGPSSIPKVLHVLDRIVAGQDGKIAALASAMARGVRPAIGRIGLSTLGTLESARFSDRHYAERAKTSEEAFQRRAAEIRSTLAQPIMKRLGDAQKTLAPLLQAHPEAAKAAFDKAEANLQILGAQLPQVAPAMAPLLDPTGAQPAPSKLHQADFADAVKAFKSPVSVFEDFAHGRVSPIAATNLRAMWPELHSEMVASVLSAVRESGKAMPYKQRLALSVFVGAPLDASLEPTSMMASQMVYAPPPAESPSTAEAPKMQSTKSVKSIANAASAMQNLESRSEHIG